MEKYIPRQYVELFHLLFLTQIGRKLDKRFYALKGGCNMRFFFKSPRYSKDIDLDIQSIEIDVLRNKINSILNSRPFRDILQVRDIEIEHITEHKQTETTQRWKTRIEFSRRGLEEPIKFELVAPEIIRAYEISPIMANHYPPEVACEQKIRALISRRVVQARDLFDLHLLLTLRDIRKKLPEKLRKNLNKAVENILSLDYATYKSQVISYLEPEDQTQYESEEVWDNMRLQVIEALSEDLS
jgi:predicted nucleotidyltransferase component of viral defense system